MRIFINIKKVVLLITIFTITKVYSDELISQNENRLLFYGNCIACHGEIGKKVAPHLSEVKGFYLLAYPTKEEFVNHMAEWLSAPNEKKALHKEAIRKYKLMPYLAIDLDTLTKIATYIYESDDFGVVGSF